MDRGIPTEKVLAEMRASETPIQYLVGTPRGRLGRLEQDFLAKPWAQVRDAVQVKLVEQDGELYILARSGARRDKEQAMRRRRLKKLIKRLHELRQQKLTRDQLLIKLGAARKEAGPAAWRIIDIQLPDRDQAVTPETFCFKLNWQKLREARRREGSYLLRSNVTGGDPAQLWGFYLQLVEVEQAFKDLKRDLAIRPIYHQTDERIEAHIFVAFLAYCLQITLKQRLRSLAPELVAVHLRSLRPNRPTTLADHMPSSHPRYRDWTHERILREAASIGDDTTALVEIILRSRPHPEQGFRSCIGILRLATRYDAERLDGACVALGTRSYSSVAAILKNAQDRKPREPDHPSLFHENIRGPGYYH